MFSKYDNLFLNLQEKKSITIKKSSAMGISEIFPQINTRRAANKVARKARKINKHNRRK